MESLETQRDDSAAQEAPEEVEVKPDIATNDLPAAEVPDAEKQAQVLEENGEHQAFLPSLQFTSGNDLTSIANYDTQQHLAGGPLRTGEGAQAYDHWPSETQGNDSTQNLGQFTQGDVTQQLDPSQNVYHEQQGTIDQHQQVAQQHTHHQMMHQHQHHHGGTPYDRPTPGASYGTYEGAKPKRKRASPQQLTLLNNIFEMTYFPSSDLRLAIGKELDMVPRSVQIWFQNRRSLWRAKAQQILSENQKRRAELLAEGLAEQEADERIAGERIEAAAREIATQRANDAVEYTINGHDGSLAYALHGAIPPQAPHVPIDDGSVVRDDEAGAWSVLQAFHQARTGIMVHQGHPPMPQRPPSVTS